MRLRQLGQGIRSLDDLSQAIALLAHEVDKQLSNGLTFQTHMDMVSFEVADSGSPGDPIQIDHSLGRAPAGFFITFKNGAGDVYCSGSLGNSSGAVIFTSGTNLHLKGFIF